MVWVRNHAHEQKVRDLYERRSQPVSAAPLVFDGFADGAPGEQLLRALLSRERWTPEDERWHLSVSGRQRVPTWDEMAMTAHELRPGVPMVLGVPPRSQWMNVNEFVLHMWETKDTGLIEQWRFEGRGDAPT
jgi:hypothetical protein